uniref:N-acetylmuramoyl-L-alanine amidase n=1 Tax=Candidatus Aschnera chinzeii TaxID=1485666 RepID=A0AAT9G405_9ENTR|nr:MAG: N-acetylmuramoyl-L-alanine amidase AmiC [Candidatus Aschnera chinzeii]
MKYWKDKKIILQKIKLICFIILITFFLTGNSIKHNFKNVKHISYSNHDKIILEFNSSIKYKKYFSPSSKDISITIYNISIKDFICKKIKLLPVNIFYLKSIKINNINNNVQILFFMSKKIKINIFTTISKKYLTYKLIINFYPIIKTSYISDTLKTKIQTNQNKKQYNKNKNNIKRPVIIMIDPGHGGEDPGAIGTKNTYEKNIVLGICQKLKFLLNNTNYLKAYMTRNNDVFMSINDRIIKTNKIHANLFISIHTDSFINKNIEGTSIFVLSTNNNINSFAKYLAYQQNNFNIIKQINKTNDKYLNHTLFDLIYTMVIYDSIKLGKIILQEIKKINKLHTNNIEQGNFAVLKNYGIPSILIEIGFISNNNEEYKLKSNIFQYKVAKAIFNGIKAYINTT